MKLLSSLKRILLKYKHGAVLLYGIIYMVWFEYLERTVTTNYTVIHSRLDNLIPFNEVFIIPYLMWFIYIFVTVAYFFLTSKSDFYKCCAYLFTGMTICLIIYTVFPNGTAPNFRVDVSTIGRSNIFTNIIAGLYKVDTNTNVFPSIHVFNSIGAAIAIRRSERLRSKIWLQWSTAVLTVLIIMSTVFLKQHSILDVFGGIVLSIIMYMIVYVPSWSKEDKAVKQELSNT